VAQALGYHVHRDAGPQQDRRAGNVYTALMHAGYSVDEINSMLTTRDGWDQAINAARGYIVQTDSIPGRTHAVAAAIGPLDDRMLTTAQSASQLSQALDQLLTPQLNLSEAEQACDPLQPAAAPLVALGQRLLVGLRAPSKSPRAA